MHAPLHIHATVDDAVIVHHLLALGAVLLVSLHTHAYLGNRPCYSGLFRVQAHAQ